MGRGAGDGGEGPAAAADRCCGTESAVRCFVVVVGDEPRWRAAEARRSLIIVAIVCLVAAGVGSGCTAAADDEEVGLALLLLPWSGADPTLRAGGSARRDVGETCLVLGVVVVVGFGEAAGGTRWG
jgi:hypothetical protein